MKNVEDDVLTTKAAHYVHYIWIIGIPVLDLLLLINVFSQPYVTNGAPLLVLFHPFIIGVYYVLARYTISKMHNPNHVTPDRFGALFDESKAGVVSFGFLLLAVILLTTFQFRLLAGITESLGYQYNAAIGFHYKYSYIETLDEEAEELELDREQTLEGFQRRESEFKAMAGSLMVYTNDGRLSLTLDANLNYLTILTRSQDLIENIDYFLENPNNLSEFSILMSADDRPDVFITHHRIGLNTVTMPTNGCACVKVIASVYITDDEIDEVARLAFGVSPNVKVPTGLTARESVIEQNPAFAYNKDFMRFTFTDTALTSPTWNHELSSFKGIVESASADTKIYIYGDYSDTRITLEEKVALMFEKFPNLKSLEAQFNVREVVFKGE